MTLNLFFSLFSLFLFILFRSHFPRTKHSLKFLGKKRLFNAWHVATLMVSSPKGTKKQYTSRSPVFFTFFPWAPSLSVTPFRLRAVKTENYTYCTFPLKANSSYMLVVMVMTLDLTKCKQKKKLWHGYVNTLINLNNLLVA